MEPKRSKYDTNPLEEDVVAHAEQSWGEPAEPTNELIETRTQEIRSREHTARQHSESEAPTRRIDAKIATSYPSIFVPSKPQRPPYEAPRIPADEIYLPPPVPPGIYQAPGVPFKQGTRKVSGLGMPEKWAVMLPYLPFWPAMVIAIVELLLAPRTETRVRFHASQALAVQIGVTAISMLLTFGGLFTERWTGAGLFNVASFVLLILAMIRVWKGKPVVIPPLDEPRKWLDEKIKPRN